MSISQKQKKKKKKKKQKTGFVILDKLLLAGLVELGSAGIDRACFHNKKALRSS